MREALAAGVALDGIGLMAHGLAASLSSYLFGFLLALLALLLLGTVAELPPSRRVLERIRRWRR